MVATLMGTTVAVLAVRAWVGFAPTIAFAVPVALAVHVGGWAPVLCGILGATLVSDYLFAEPIGELTAYTSTRFASHMSFAALVAWLARWALARRSLR